MENNLTPLTPEAMRDAGLEAIRKAEKARNRAQRRAQELEAQARRHLQLQAYAKLPLWRRWFARVRPEDLEVDERLVEIVGGTWASDDPTWNTAVSNNRWYLSQAAAYGANK